MYQIYVAGFIHETLVRHLNEREYISEKIKSLSKVLKDLEKLKRALNDIRQFIENRDLLQSISNDIATVEDLIVKFKKAENATNSGADYYDKTIINFEFKCSKEKLKGEKYSFSKYFHFHEVEKSLIDSEKSVYEYSRFFDKEITNTLILLGNPGTGKTSGIVNEVFRLFEDKSNLPILIDAKRININKTWKDILIDYLGISNEWDESELFLALKTSALLRYKSIDCQNAYAT